MTADKIIELRTRVQMSQQQLANYLEWALTTIQRYEGGGEIPHEHRRRLVALIDGPTAESEEGPRRSLDRRYASGGYCFDESSLIEEYRKVMNNSIYDPLMRAAHATRYHMLTAPYRRQPKGF